MVDNNIHDKYYWIDKKNITEIFENKKQIYGYDINAIINSKIEDIDYSKGIGKWLLFINNTSESNIWEKILKLYNEKYFNDVISIKCSKESDKFNQIVVMFYCDNSDNSENIINIGRNIIKLLNYKNNKNNYIYYKSDIQTWRSDLGIKYLYKLDIKNCSFNNFETIPNENSDHLAIKTTIIINNIKKDIKKDIIKDKKNFSEEELDKLFLESIELEEKYINKVLPKKKKNQ